MVYSVKANAFDSVHNWFIIEDMLIREQNGVKNLKILFTDIKWIRLYHNPMRCMANNYECEVLTVRKQKYKIRSSSYESFANFSSQAENYVLFVEFLIKSVRKKNNNAEFIAGYSKKGFIVNYSISFLIIAFIGYILEPITSSLFNGMVMLSYGVYILIAFKKNWPQKIVENEVPLKVLPNT